MGRETGYLRSEIHMWRGRFVRFTGWIRRLAVHLLNLRLNFQPAHWRRTMGTGHSLAELFQFSVPLELMQEPEQASAIIIEFRRHA